MSDSRNLPAFVQNMGGQVAEVLSWPQYLSVLNEEQTTQIGMLVSLHPTLNTQNCVDMLANLASMYREELGPQFNSLLEQHGIEDVHLAVETLYELGVCRAGEMQEMVETTTHGSVRTHPLDQMLIMMDRLRQVPQHFDGVMQLAQLIEDLGGWDEIHSRATDREWSQRELEELKELLAIVGPVARDRFYYGDEADFEGEYGPGAHRGGNYLDEDES